MKHLNSLGEMAMELALMVPRVAVELHEGLKAIALRIEVTAWNEIGHYQNAVGPFPAWEPLADSTEDEKRRLGYPQDAPLLRTGDMRASLGHEVEGLEAVIGSTDEKMVWHEFGTTKMPARPVLGPALFRNKAAIQKLVGAALVSGLIGQDQIHAALGYDFETKD